MILGNIVLFLSFVVIPFVFAFIGILWRKRGKGQKRNLTGAGFGCRIMAKVIDSSLEIFKLFNLSV